MPTTGWFSTWGAEPQYVALPKALTAPLELVNQYPLPRESEAMATMGRLWGTPPSEPS